MKLIEKYIGGKPVYVNLKWGDHWPGCEKCREVDLEKSATFHKVCAMGAPLLNEQLIERQAPRVKQAANEVREWARKAGCFKM